MPAPADSRNRGGLRPRRRGAGRRARAPAGGHGRCGPFMEAHERVQMEGVRTVFRGHRAVPSLHPRVGRDRRDRGRHLSAPDGSGGDRPRADLPLSVSVRQLRLHVVLLRPAGTEGSIRLGAPEPTPRGGSREGVSFAPQAADPDSLRAALRTVFAAREYRWSEPSSTWSWLLAQWQRVLDWLEGLRLVSPVRYYLVLGVLTVALVASTRLRRASGSMLRRGERAVVLGAIVAIVLAAVAGVITAPTRDLDDPRLSTYLAGPHGAKGLAQTLRHLGITVEQRRRSYFDVASDGGRPRRAVLLAFLDIDRPTARELAAVRDYVTRGGRVFVAGVTGIETCFGYYSGRLRRGGAADSSVIRTSVPGRLPRARRVLLPLPAESLANLRADGPGGDRCPPRFAGRVDTLLGTRDGRPVAFRLAFPSGGEVTLLADAGFLSNRSLKESDAGPP